MADTPGKKAWRKLRRNRPAMAGLAIIALGVLLALAGYLVVPDGTRHANTQVVEQKLKPPGYRATLLLVHLDRPIARPNIVQRLWQGGPVRFRPIPVFDYRIEGHKLWYRSPDSSAPERSIALAEVAYPLSLETPTYDTAAGLVHFTDAAGRAKSVPIDELRTQVERKHIVTRTYLLGTDALGRDYLSRLLLGARVSLAVGLMAVLISLCIGLVVGISAGYFRGKLDEFIMYGINVFWAIPTLLLALSLSLIFERGMWQVFLAIGLTMWVELARVVRGQVLGLREMEYIKAAQVMGFGDMRIMLRHLLPNLIGPVIVLTASNFAAAILLEAGLSFLGLGVERPTPSWGTMLSDNRSYLVAGLPHLAILPGAAISLFVLAFFLLGNGLRDAFDVRIRAMR